MRLARQLADKLVAAMVPRAEAAAGYWRNYCGCSGGYSRYEWCETYYPGGVTFCSCQPRWCCGPYC